MAERLNNESMVKKIVNKFENKNGEDGNSGLPGQCIKMKPSFGNGHVELKGEGHFTSIWQQITKRGFTIRVAQSCCVFITIFLMSYYILWWRHEVGHILSIPVSLAFATMTSIAFVFSVAVRCVTALSLATITGQQGRLILLSVITGTLVGGPLVSIMYNINEASVTISCTVDLAQKQGTAMVDGYREAYKDMSDALENNIKTWVKVSDGIQTALQPIGSGLKSVDESFKDAKKSIEEAAEKCQQGVDNAYHECDQGTRNSYEECKRKVPSFGWNNVKDLPGKLPDIPGTIEDVGRNIKDFFGGRKKRFANLNDICEVMKIADQVCKPLKIVNVCQALEFPRTTVLGIVSRMNGLLSSFAQLFDFKISVDNSYHGKVDSTINGTEINRKVREEFEEKYRVVLLLVLILRIIFILPIFYIPISSAIYLRKYLKCRHNKKPNNLVKFIKKQNKKDKSSIINQIVQLITHLILSMSLFCFDHTLYWIENVINKHGHTTFTAKGEVDLGLSTLGGPIIKPLVDVFVDTFKLERSHNFTIDTNPCLPEPMSPNGLTNIIFIMVIYVLAFVFIFAEFNVAKRKTKIIEYIYQDVDENDRNVESNKVLIK